MTVTVPPPFAVAPAAEPDDDEPPQPQANKMTAADTSASPARADTAGFPPGSAGRLFCIVAAPSARSSGRPRLPASAGTAAPLHEVLLRFVVVRVGLPHHPPRDTPPGPPAHAAGPAKPGSRGREVTNTRPDAADRARPGPAGGADQALTVLADAGCDELILFPCNPDIAQVSLAAEAAGP